MQFDRRMHEQQGLGLGLTIAKRLVALHGGTLSIESTKDNGATIIAKLPKTKPAEQNGSLLKGKSQIKSSQAAFGQFRQQKDQRPFPPPAQSPLCRRGAVWRATAATRFALQR